MEAFRRGMRSKQAILECLPIYEEERRALQHTGIEVRIYRHADPDYPHCVITARPEFFER